MRGIKIEVPAELPEVKRPDDRCTDTLVINVETPMVGGGVEAGKVDRFKPVRVPSVRGHLRTWWRMIHQDNAKSLAESEAEIWGSTETKSQIFVEVSSESPVNLRRHSDNFGFNNYGPEAYALFAARESKERYDIAEENFSFTLKITYPQKYQQEIRLALAAWIYFGGVGARTRRGCGSLSCKEFSGGKLPSVKEVLKAARSITLWRKTRNESRAITAWADVLRLYKNYRQNRNRGQAPNRPGRSRWPEPDSIRQITGCSLPQHLQPINNPIAPVSSFPRAALGLPINFKFKDDNDKDKDKIDPKREPYQTQLKPKGSNRMSSPVITKALCEDGRIYSAVVILPHDDFRSHALELVKISKNANTVIADSINKSSYDSVSGFESLISINDFKKEVI